MFAWHHMDASLSLPAWSIAVRWCKLRACIYFPYSNCMIFFQPSCKPVVLNKYVLMFGLHHMDCIVTLCILVACFVVIAYLKYSSEMVRTCTTPHILTAWLSSNLWRKPRVLDKQMLIFGLLHIGCVVRVHILAGCLRVIACFKLKLWDGLNLH